MSSIYEEISLELKHETNRCRMELVSMQDQYYMLMIKNLFVTYLKHNENIELYSKKEISEMMNFLGDTMEEIGVESRIDGTQKYDIKETWPFIQECMKRVMKKYGFTDWVME